MPSLARLQSQFDPAQFQVVTVTTDMHPQGIKQFLNHLGIRLPVLFDESQDVSRSFMVRGLPTTVLIQPDGRAVGRAVGPRAWDGEESVALMRHVLEGMK
jgi:peroxiredoxin